MSTGKHLSLEEARKKGKLKQFVKKHQTEGNEKQFDDMLNDVSRNLLKDNQTSKQA